MHTLPNITITNRDAARLETLLEGLPAGSFAGLKALEDELYRATLVAPEEIPPTVVTMNSTRSMPRGDRLLWASGRTSMAKRPSVRASRG